MNTILASPRFHTGAIAALAGVVLVGFAKSYYFSFLFDSPPLTRSAHLHGIIASIWITLHYTQARLIAAHRVGLHRQLGTLAACVAALLTVQAAFFAIDTAAAGHAPPGRNPLQFMSVSLGTTLTFALFVTSALALRRKREWHKRLMLLATMTLLVPAAGRLDTQVMQPLGVPRGLLALVITAAFVAWAWAHDWRQLGRVHVANIVGGIALLVSVQGRSRMGLTDAWMPIAQWLVS